MRRGRRADHTVGRRNQPRGTRIGDTRGNRHPRHGPFRFHRASERRLVAVGRRRSPPRRARSRRRRGHPQDAQRIPPSHRHVVHGRSWRRRHPRRHGRVRSVGNRRGQIRHDERERIGIASRPPRRDRRRHGHRRGQIERGVRPDRVDVRFGGDVGRDHPRHREAASRTAARGGGRVRLWNPARRGRGRGDSPRARRRRGTVRAPRFDVHRGVQRVRAPARLRRIGYDAGPSHALSGIRGTVRR
mmetsp:Transcript_38099/g.113828  ORF Transcript_38099/g.113828 Transcript_38099/m.113828 type:complete len:244 (-) Transcript_38099:799-1530(-)